MIFHSEFSGGCARDPASSTARQWPVMADWFYSAVALPEERPLLGAPCRTAMMRLE